MNILNKEMVISNEEYEEIYKYFTIGYKEEAGEDIYVSDLSLREEDEEVSKWAKDILKENSLDKLLNLSKEEVRNKQYMQKEKRKWCNLKEKLNTKDKGIQKTDYSVYDFEEGEIFSHESDFEQFKDKGIQVEEIDFEIRVYFFDEEDLSLLEDYCDFLKLGRYKGNDEKFKFKILITNLRLGREVRLDEITFNFEKLLKKYDIAAQWKTYLR